MDRKNWNLSTPQNSIWFTEEYLNGTAIHTIGGCATIYEKVNFDVLNQAMQNFVKYKNPEHSSRGSVHQGLLLILNVDFISASLIQHLVSKTAALFQCVKNDICNKNNAKYPCNSWNFFCFSGCKFTDAIRNNAPYNTLRNRVRERHNHNRNKCRNSFCRILKIDFCHRFHHQVSDKN